ncbi:NAD-dependent epimerase/dehydratase family protein [Chishuiella changwenlii]|uniref:NAD-dependent epimerase/dehydratase family protein n=1 Tax=Chishuiella changwenlii TaxID=1434701 RepID=UPI002FDAA0AE
MIFVTGGTGLVGSHLLVELARKQQPIRALKRETSDIKSIERFFEAQNATEYYKYITWVNGDLSDITKLPDLLKDIETIYHTAAFVSFDKKDDDEIFETNILGTEALVNEAIDSKIKDFFFVSSIAAMDDLNPVTKKIDELSAWNNSLTHSSYAISKFRAEMEVWRASQEGINVIIVNPGVIIGSINGRRASEKLFDQNSIISKYAPSGGTAFVDVRDVVKVLLELVQQKIYNQKFILIAENRSYKDVLNYVAKKNNAEIKLISNSTLKAIKIFSSISRIFGGKYLTKATYYSLTSKIKYDNSKICKTLDYSFIPIEEAINYHYSNYQKLISTK